MKQEDEDVFISPVRVRVADELNTMRELAMRTYDTNTDKPSSGV